MKRSVFTAVCFAVFSAALVCADVPVSFDHTLLNKVLTAFVKDGRVDYAALKAGRADLDKYVKNLGEFRPEDYDGLSEKHKIAFWVNAYNAVTLKVIVDHYPIVRGGGLTALAFPSNSIRQIPGAWNRITHKVLGQEMTLDQIEHEILRKQFKEPRIHMALVCAAKGCPPLRSEAYSGDRLDAQFDDQARKFFANPEKAKFDSAHNKLALSPIFKWFKGDFEKSGGLYGFINKYLPREPASQVSAGTKIDWLNYDWTLNDKAA